jgi:hypothetical protein
MAGEHNPTNPGSQRTAAGVPGGTSAQGGQGQQGGVVETLRQAVSGVGEMAGLVKE